MFFSFLEGQIEVSQNTPIIQFAKIQLKNEKERRKRGKLVIQYCQYGRK